MTSKKHCDIIKKWADGADVQISYDGEWTDTQFPTFDDKEKYRIKPRIVRIALHRGMSGVNVPLLWHGSIGFAEIEKYDTFIQWLTEEIEYEM